MQTITESCIITQIYELQNELEELCAIPEENRTDSDTVRMCDIEKRIDKLTEQGMREET